jgi:hypothetical protein
MHPQLGITLRPSNTVVKPRPCIQPQNPTRILKRNHQQLDSLPLLLQPYKPRWADMRHATGVSRPVKMGLLGAKLYRRWTQLQKRAGKATPVLVTFFSQLLCMDELLLSVASRGLLMSWLLTGLKAEMSLSAVFLGVHDCMRIKGQQVSSSPLLLFTLFYDFSEEFILMTVGLNSQTRCLHLLPLVLPPQARLLPKLRLVSLILVIDPKSRLNKRLTSFGNNSLPRIQAKVLPQDTLKPKIY